MARTGDQLDGEIALGDRAGLADLAKIHPDEVRGFGREAGRVGLAGGERLIEERGEVVKVRFHDGWSRCDVARRVHDSASARIAMTRASSCRPPEALALPSIPTLRAGPLAG